MNANEYEAKIKRYTWPDLRVLWKSVLERNTPDWPLGKALEYLIVRAFELNRAEVAYPFSVRGRQGGELEQIDGMVYWNGLVCALECKDQEKSRLNHEPIDKMRGILERRPSVVIGSIFSVSGYTPNSLEKIAMISPQRIILWEREEIEYSLKNESITQSLLLKYRGLVEYGVANFNLAQP